MGYYRAYGLDIRVPFTGSEYEKTGSDPKLEVRYGDVAHSLDEVVKETVCCQASADQTLFRIDGIGRYLVDGRADHITIDRQTGADAAAVETFLWGPVLAAWMYRQGHIVLHACAIEIDGRAVLFAGKPGSGKSTIAALMAEQGHRVLADDYCVIATVDGKSAPQVLPGHPALKLWPTTLRQLGRDPGMLAPLRPGVSRRRVPLGDSHCSRPLPLACVFELENGPWKSAPLDGHARFFTQIRHTFHASLQQAALGAKGPFQQCFRLAPHAPLVRLGLPKSAIQAPEFMPFLEQALYAYA